MVADRDVPPLPRRRGQKAPVPLRDLLLALTIHVLNEAGALSEHFAQLFDEPLANSSWADCRARLPWEICGFAAAHAPAAGHAAAVGQVCQGCRRSCKSYMKPIC